MNSEYHLLSHLNTCSIWFQEICLKAGYALSIFAFNNTAQQLAIKEAGGIQYNCFQQFMESDDLYEQCNAAFQVNQAIHFYLARISIPQCCMLTDWSLALVLLQLKSEVGPIAILTYPQDNSKSC